MPKTIISDTSCLIVLTNIGELELLHKIYGQITTTSEVAKEFDEQLPDWVEIIDPTYHHKLIYSKRCTGMSDLSL